MIARQAIERSAQLSPNAAAAAAVRPNLMMSDMVDLGYDTESIAIFEIDKAFTDYLLCQICFSKYPISRRFMVLSELTK